MKTRFIHVRSRKLAPACLFLWSKPGSNLMRYSSLSSALHRSSGDFKTRQRIGFSVSPQLQFGRSLFVSRCNYLPRSSIWPVGSFGIYRPWKYQTQTLWVVPSIHFKFRHADLRCTIHRSTLAGWKLCLLSITRCETLFPPRILQWSLVVFFGRSDFFLRKC